MYLGYLDDTGSDEKAPLAIMAAVLINHLLFYQIEEVAGKIIGDLIPEGNMYKFKEFKAVDLFHGHKAFEGLLLEHRLAAMQSLLQQIRRWDIPVIYSAVDSNQLDALAASHLLVPADPMFISFTMCLLGVQSWLDINGRGELGAARLERAAPKKHSRRVIFWRLTRLHRRSNG